MWLMNALLEHATQAYAYDYFGVLLALAVLEWTVPQRRAEELLGARWFGNIGVALLDTILLRVLFPVAGVVWAGIAVDQRWGLFNRVAVPVWIGVIASIVAMDFLSYAEHYLFHRIPVLWRLHLTHHTDQEVDLTTGLRFHPIESMITTGSRLGLIALLGLPPAGVLISALLIVVVSFWEHANVRVPPGVDRALRLLIVTPEWHRTHHSQDGRDNRSNFGGLTTCWDRLFRTYREQSTAGARLIPGVRGFEDRKHLQVHWMLAQPFLRTDDDGSAASSAGSFAEVKAQTPE
jgi:sterol desaturase/sphingolipid hydroxylase (fatty acid hydroxylase superfamily)